MRVVAMEQHPAEAEPVHAPERLVGFDLIRAWAFTTVILYHSTWFYWPGEAGCPDRMDTLFSHVIIDIYGRPGSYSGQTLVFITAFLFGLKRRLFAGKTWLPIFLFIGWFVFSLILVWHDGGPFRMAWDVYPLLLVGTVSGTLLYRTESKPLLATVVGLMVVALSIPFWELEGVLPYSYWTQVLVGICPNADWPILPWIFLVWGGIALGRLYRLTRREHPQAYFRMKRGERIAVVGALVALAYVSISRWTQAPCNAQYACFALRQPWPTFWGYFAGLLAMMRASVDPDVQRWLERTWLTRKISGLAFNRHFAVAYVGHFIALALLTMLFSEIDLFETTHGYDIGIAAALLSGELIPRAYRAILRRRASAAQ